MIRERIRLLSRAESPIISIKRATSVRMGKCWACGARSVQWRFETIISDDLAKEWQISGSIRKSFDERESAFCATCQCSYRQRQLAQAIARQFGASSLKQSVDSLSKFDVAEINSCGNLHQFFNKLPNLYYSEYGSTNPEIPSENLEDLSYSNDSLDFIFTSDTLEHVPDLQAALREIYRVLRPGGFHIFSIPVVWDRRTRERAKMISGSVQHSLPPSYHGEGQSDFIVFREFGYDTLDLLEEADFDVKLFGQNTINLNDSSGIFISMKPDDRARS